MKGKRERESELLSPKAQALGKVCASLLGVGRSISQPSRVRLLILSTPPHLLLSLLLMGLWQGPQEGIRVRVGPGLGQRGKGPPGEECSESRNSMAGVGLLRRI